MERIVAIDNVRWISTRNVNLAPELRATLRRGREQLVEYYDLKTGFTNEGARRKAEVYAAGVAPSQSYEVESPNAVQASVLNSSGAQVHIQIFREAQRATANAASEAIRQAGGGAPR